MLSKLFKPFFSEAFWSMFWRYRHLWDRKWPEGYTNEESLNSPHRKLILEAVRQFEPFENLLEYGCGPGANLALLADRYPKSHFVGVDISEVALRMAIKRPNIEYMRKRPEGDFSIFLTDACLLYQEKPWAFFDAIRTYGRGYVGCEWHDDNGPFKRRYYVHNFKKRLAGCQVRKLTWDDWQDERWSTYGHIITWKR